MRRWLIELEGDKYDVDEFSFWFPSGNVHVISEGDKAYMTGAAFSELAGIEQVHEVALHAVDEMTGVIKLLVGPLLKPSIGKICWEDDGGERRCVSIGVASCHMRTKMRMISGTDGQGEPTVAQQLLAASKVDRHLEVAVFLWADSQRTWSRLYRVLEEIESHLGAKVSKSGLTSENERQRFTRSANDAHAAGKDSRHGFGRSKTSLQNPMTLSEAAKFIGGLLDRTLRRLVLPTPETNTGDISRQK